MCTNRDKFLDHSETLWTLLGVIRDLAGEMEDSEIFGTCSKHSRFLSSRVCTAERYGTFRDHTGQFGTFRVYSGPFGNILDSSGLVETFLDCWLETIEKSSVIRAKQFRTFRDDSKKNIDDLEIFGTIRDDSRYIWTIGDYWGITRRRTADSPEKIPNIYKCSRPSLSKE